MPTMESKKRDKKRVFHVLLLLGFLACLLISVLFFYVYGYFGRTITSGNFYGLSINDTKAETLKKIVANPNFSGVTPYLAETIKITATNTEHLSELSDYPGFIIRGINVFIIVGHDGTLITSIRPETRIQNDLSFFVGEPLRDALATVKLAIESDTSLSVMSAIPDNKTVLVQSSLVDEDQSFLISFDVWSFGDDRRHNMLWLKFIDDRLVSIRYRNYFSG